MNLSWRALREEEIGLLLPMMEAFAHGERQPFERARAERNLRYLLGHPIFGGVWFICQDDARIGYLVVTLGYSFEFGGHDSFVDEIYVLPEHRGKGVGTRSLAFAEVAAGSLGATTLHLEAARREGGPAEFYARCGYVDRGYELMSKRLSTP
ncbi:MAG: GNAT family N-acetyltransferase [Gammaproteobacteria bacterium]